MRIIPRLLNKANIANPLLSRLLPICESLESAQAELRWLTEHATKESSAKASQQQGCNSLRPPSRHDRLQSYITRRVGGEPLQYILGSEYFGDLKIQCRPGVLIPRQETASSVTYLIRKLLARTKAAVLVDSVKREGYLPLQLSVLDLCTGSGCIPLLVHRDFYSQTTWPMGVTHLKIAGADISLDAIRLAKENREIEEDYWNGLSALRDSELPALSKSQEEFNSDILAKANVEPAQSALRGMTFFLTDILGRNQEGSPPFVSEALKKHCGSIFDGQKVDILISNPPYISPHGFRTATEDSVRRFEPELALVPQKRPDMQLSDTQHGDLFYPHLLAIARSLHSRIFMFEVADLEQAKRVAEMAETQGIWTGLEIWRDWMDQVDLYGPQEPSLQLRGGRKLRLKGKGHGRTVVGWRVEGGAWLDEPPSPHMSRCT